MSNKIRNYALRGPYAELRRERRRLKSNFNSFSLPGQSLVDSTETLQEDGSTGLNNLNHNLTLKSNNRREQALANQQQERIAQEPNWWEEIPVAGSLLDFAGNAIWGFAESFVVPTAVDMGTGGKISQAFGSQDWKDESAFGKVGYTLGTGLGFISGVGIIGKILSGGTKFGRAASHYYADDIAKQLVKMAPEAVSKKTAERSSARILKVAQDSIQEGVDSQLKGTTPLLNFFKRRGIKGAPLNNPSIMINTQQYLSKEMAEMLGLQGDDLAKAVQFVMNTAGKSRAHNFGHHLTQRLMNRGVFGSNPWNKKVWGENIATRLGDALYEGTLLATHGVVLGEAADYYAESIGLGKEEWNYDTVMHRALHGFAMGGALSQFRTIQGGKMVNIGQSGMIADMKDIGKAIYYNFSSRVKDMSPKAMQSTLRIIFDTSGKRSSIFKNVEGMGETLLNKTILSEADEVVLKNAMKWFQGNLPKTIKKLSKEMMRDGLESSKRAIPASMFMNYEMWKDAHEKGILFTEEYDWDRLVFDLYVGWIYMKRGKEIKTLKGKEGYKFPKYYEEVGIEPKGNEIALMERYLTSIGKKDSDLALIHLTRGFNANDSLTERIEREKINGNEDLAEINKKVQKEMLDSNELAKFVEANPETKPWYDHIMEAADTLTRKIDKATGKEKAALESQYKELIEQKIVAETMIAHMLVGNQGKTLRPMTPAEALEFVNKMASYKIEGGTKKLTVDNVESALEGLRHHSVNEVTRVIRDFSIEYLRESLSSLGLWSEANMGPDGRIQIHSSVLTALDKGRAINLKGGVNLEPAFYQLAEMIRQAEAAGVVRLGDYGVKFRTQDMKGIESLDKFNQTYHTYTERMHDIIFNDGTTSSNWRQIVPGWSKEKGYYDASIMSSTAVWHAVQTQQRLARHDFAYRVLTGKGKASQTEVGEVFLQLRDWFGGNKRIEFEAGVELKDIPPELQLFIDRLNTMHALMNPEASQGSRTVTISEMKNIMEKVSDPSKGIGNLFIDGVEFQHFQQYVYKRFINDLTGNANLGAGLKRVLAKVLELENPLSLRRRGGVELITARTLREVMLGDKAAGDKLTLSEKHSLELIEKYEQKIERPLRSELAKQNALVSFNDKIKPQMDFIDKGEIKQSLQEMLSQINRIHEYELVSIANDIARMGGELSKVLDRLATQDVQAIELGNKKAVEKIKDAVADMSKSQGQLESLVAMYIANRDMVGLRTLVNNRSKLLEEIHKMSIDPVNDSKSIIRYKEFFQKYVENAIRERNQKLDLSEIKDVDSYIEQQLADINVTDRSGRVKTNHHTLSDNQYVARWHGNDMNFIEILKKQPLELLAQIENLDANARTLITEYQKNPDIMDPSSTTFIGIKSYVDTVIKPILESQRGRIEQMDVDPKLGKTATEKYERFVLDTYQVLTSGVASKRVALGIFENGTLHISEGRISNADTGINKLQRKLGIGHLDGTIVLAGSRMGTERGFTSRLTRSVLDALEAKMSAGTFLDISAKEVMSGQDKLLLENFERQIAGTGYNGSTKYLPVLIDGRTMIFVHKAAGKSIMRTWADPASEIRRELLTVFEGNPNAEAIVKDYLSKHLNAEVNRKGHAVIQESASNMKKLILLTRMLQVGPDAVKKMITDKMSPLDALSELKYEMLDSPRSGIALNDRTLLFTREFLKTMLPKSSLDQGAKIFNEHIFDSKGKITKHRKLTIKDESGIGKDFFSTDKSTVKDLTKTFMEKYDMSKEKAEERAKELLDIYKPIAASSVNAETYLSLPEMVSQLMAKGANPDWFIKNNAGEIIGFNVVIKPIENHTAYNLQTGEITVFQGKTAYKYHPTMDKAMQGPDGKYIMDSISFESAAKKNLRKAPGETEFKSRNMDLNPKNVPEDGNFVDRLSRGIENSTRRANIIELPRESIFIKSISGEHEATMSSGYTNFLSNDALRSIQSITNANHNVNDLMSRYKSMWENPFTYLEVARQMRQVHAENGNMAAKLLGIEGIMQAGGLPVFEYMGPQIERMMNAEYLSNRDFASSSLKHGSYNVMTAGSDLSAPVRVGGKYSATYGASAEGLQLSFGGSGIPYTQYNKPITDLLVASKSGAIGEGNQGISLSFTIDKALIKRFKMEDMIGVGHDVLVTHDGQVLGPHQRKYSMSQKAKIQEFENYLKEQYQFVLSEASKSDAITLGDLALFISGQKDKSDFMLDIKLGNSSKDAMAQKITLRKTVAGVSMPGTDKAFKAVHVAAIDLRTPKAGLNDWVITKIEKLLDRRRGPVSEMNKLDVLDPQDADFDLDKSSSIHALPGAVIKEMYHVSGIIDPAQRIFDRVLDEIRLENPDLRADYYIKLKTLEAKRPLLVRQHSIASFLLQSFVAEKPGYDPFGRNYGNKDFALSQMSVNNTSWRISFKGDQHLRDSVGHLKSLIKETIDIYKRTGNIDERNLVETVWNDPKTGMFKIEFQNKKGEWESLDWNQSNAVPKEVVALRDRIRRQILNPLGSLFDIATMNESFVDGTSRKMSLYDMVSRFQNVKNSIRWAGQDFKGYDKKGKVIVEKNDLNNLSTQMLKFLGVFPGSAGISEHPLIKGLITMERGMSKHFSDRPAHDTNIGTLLAGVAGRGEADISRAISNIIKDQSKWAQLNYLAFEVDQIADTMSMYRAMGKRNTTQYDKLQSQYEFKVQVLNEFNKQINNPANIDPSQVKMLRPGRNRAVPKEWGKVGHYTLVEGELRLVNVLDGYKGDRVQFVKKGDQFVINYKVLRLSNESINRQRRSMSRAFAVEHPGLGPSNHAVINDITTRYNRKILKAAGIVDKNAPMSSEKYGLVSEAQLQVLTEHLMEAMNSSPLNGTTSGLQFLYNVLSPKAERGVYDVISWDAATGQHVKMPHWKSNKLNERLVFTLLDRLRLDKGSQVVDHSLAEEWYQDIIKRHKTAFLKEWDPTLQGDVFFDYLPSAREKNDFSIMSRPDVLPNWVKTADLNTQAKDIMLSYLNGSYFLDPVELYRLSAGLGNTSMGRMPDASTIGSRVDYMWRGTDGYRLDPTGQWYLPKKTYRRSIHESVDRKANLNAKEKLKQELEKINCN